MDALIIFVKNPELGRCKTRLAATIGDVKALEVYKRLLHHTRQTAASVNCQRMLFYDNKIEESDDWDKRLYHKNLQSKGDLGNRMNAAFELALSSNDKAVIIGSDCPQINKSTIDIAFQQLDNYDHVIGPTFDGGYYLLGMKRSSPFLFENMTWSIDSVFSKTVERMLKQKRSYYVLEKFSDLDDENDLNKFPHFSP